MNARSHVFSKELSTQDGTFYVPGKPEHWGSTALDQHIVNFRPDPKFPIPPMLANKRLQSAAVGAH